MKTRNHIVALSATVMVAASLAAAIDRWQAVPSPDGAAPGATPADLRRPSPDGAIRVAPVLADGTTTAALPARRRTAAALTPKPSAAQVANRERVRMRAAALAEQFTLSTSGKEQLTTVLLQEQTRRAVALDELRRSPGDDATLARVRDALTVIREWKARELRTRFGVEQGDLLMRRR